jgi:hypothetical protein
MFSNVVVALVAFFLTSMEDVTAGQAEREKPNRMETARKVGKV